MVRVPEYVANVTLRPDQRQDIEVRATPEAYGSDIGRGLAAVGTGLGEVSDAVRKVEALTDEAKSKSSGADFINRANKLLYDADGGYANTQGSAAMSKRKEFESGITELERTIKKDMTPAQAQLFERHIASAKSGYLAKGMIHEASERKKYIVDAAKASAESFANEAVSNANDPKKRDENLARGVTELQELGGKLGWSDEKLRLEAKGYVSNSHVRIANEIAQSNPIAGLEYLTQKKNLLLPEDAAKAIGNLAKVAGVAIIDDGVKHRGAGGPPPKDAASLIRSFEGWRDTPYWDVNAHRVGYGSDTITRADGSVQRVQKGMQITREDGERDLQRRIAQEFVPGIVKMVGADKWRGLSDPAKAALTSIAYNYGQLPFVVANAVVTGGPEQIAQAVESLKSQNAGINAGRRQKEAAIIRGGAMPAGLPGAGTSTGGASSGAGGTGSGGGAGTSGEPVYSARIAALLAQLPASLSTQLREATQAEMGRAEAREAAQFKAQRAELVDAYRLRVATDDQSLTRREILDDPILDKGDKATLVKSFDSSRKELQETQQAVSAFQAGKLIVDPYSSDGKKTVDRAWTMISGTIPQDQRDQRLAALEAMVRQAGIVPESIMHAVRGDLSGTAPASVAGAAEIALRLRGIDPAAIERRTGGKEVLDAAVAFDHLTRTVGLDRLVAAKRLIDMRDPEKMRAREALMKSEPIKDFIDAQATEAEVSNVFDKGWFGGRDPKLGDNPAQSAAMVDEYKFILKESLFDTAGDQDLAKKMAADRFRRRYAPSEFTISGDGVVARLPVEVTYPADANGKRDYVRTQAREALKGAGVAADQVFLQSDDQTERDFTSGRPARYQVFYRKDGVTERFHLPFYATAPTKEEIAAAKRAQSERRRDENRDILEGGPIPGASLSGAPVFGQ